MNSQSSVSLRGSNGRFVPGVRYSRKTEFKKGQHWRRAAAFRESDYLVREYIHAGRSAGDIAKEHGVTESAILHWLRRHAIKRRNVAQARKLKRWRLSGSANGMFGRTGARNPRYIDGSSPERQRLYSQASGKEFVRRIYERDGYKCQRCDSPHSKRNRLHAHHLKGWAGHPELRFDPNNVLTLCSDCHNWVHSKRNKDHAFILS